MGEVALRASRHLRRMHAEQPGRCVVMVTHAEVIRAVVLHHLRRSFDDFLGVPIEPASVTTIRLHRRGADIVDINACLEDVAAA
jgi:ribonuclease H / adenosylcobalamin/alpha-ribazole phosphatase